LRFRKRGVDGAANNRAASTVRTMARRTSNRVPSPSPDGCAACSACGLRDLCLPAGLSDSQMRTLEPVVSQRVGVAPGAHLYRRGARFEALYAVRRGFLKTRTLLENGREHVSAFHMAGELLGFDGIGLGRHTCDAVALEDSTVCVVPYRELELLAREVPQLQRHLHQMMGREIVQNQNVMLLMASMRSELRIAAFLLNLARRQQMRGFSPAVLRLRMTREEIGTHLGLTIETVSRCFSRFSSLGVLRVNNRDVEVLDPGALERMVKAVSVSASAGGAAHDPACCDTGASSESPSWPSRTQAPVRSSM
jgi:CRP/FNR family transcriptional regulator